jgi:hypothetical protein
VAQAARLEELDSELRDAERALDRFLDTSNQLADFQRQVDAWIAEVASRGAVPTAPASSEPERGAFLNALRRFLTSLGHSAVDQLTAENLRFDEGSDGVIEYLPMMGRHRLKALGSASDHARTVAAYSLALAEGSVNVGGYHPGFVVLDEPLQQNPDEKHRRLFIHFLTQTVKTPPPFQIIILTSLLDHEIAELRQAKVPLRIPAEAKFLGLVPPARNEPVAAGESADSSAGIDSAAGAVQATSQSSGFPPAGGISTD